MNYKLTIYPCLETANQAFTTEFFEFLVELVAAKNACANLLLFLQDRVEVMDDESNMFICEVYIDGEWEELDLDDYE
jgi:hypothetical protein